MNERGTMQPGRSRVPSGVRLDEQAFLARHRVLSGILLAHLPVVATVALLAGSAGAGVWWQLGAVLVLAVGGAMPLSQALRACSVSAGLVIGASALLLAGGGLTDLHIWFYVLLPLISLYQAWPPFLLAIAFVAVHHVGVSLVEPAAVFSSHHAQGDALPYALLHAVFLLVEAVFLAYGWASAAAAEELRRHERELVEQQQAAALETEAALAAERVTAALDAQTRAAERDRRAADLQLQVTELGAAGARLVNEVETVGSVLAQMRSATEEIAASASVAGATARDASDQSSVSAGRVERLGTTMAEIDQIAGTISSIADQTNLLALNATIESARAGEAGRGFAVVAGEVKDLAAETASATERIRRVVDTVRSDVAAVGTSLQAVLATMVEVDIAQEIIAGAVSAQTDATRRAEEAMAGAIREAGSMASGLRAIAST